MRHWPGKDFLSLMVSGDASPSEASNIGSQERSLLARMGHQLPHLKPAVQSERNSRSHPESSKHPGDPNQANLEGFAVSVFLFRQSLSLPSIRKCKEGNAFLPVSAKGRPQRCFSLSLKQLMESFES